MKAEITYMWGDWPKYIVDCIEDCRDETDRSAYRTLIDFGGGVVKMGKVCVEEVEKCQTISD